MLSKIGLKKLLSTVERYRLRASRLLNTLFARLDSRFYRLRRQLARRQRWIYLAACALTFMACCLALPWLDKLVSPVLTPGRVAAVQQVLMALGAALVGATVITFSFITFALQVNVERMPFGLFRRISSDWRLLVAFLSAFAIATAILGLSLIDEPSRISFGLMCALCGTLSVVGLILYSYDRALQLINPVQQLALVLKTARREMRVWSARANRAAILIADSQPTAPTADERETVDTPRLTFFRLNSNWTQGAQKGIAYSMAYVRHYSERGDHEVANSALSVVVGINAAYVAAKGKTFFAYNPFFENSLSTDGFVNETLELLRQNAQIGVSRRDERQIEQTFAALLSLTTVYAGIDYPGIGAPKSHAHLAAGYLANAVKATLPHDLTDVAMQGALTLGRATAHLLASEPDSTGALGSIQNLVSIAASGFASESLRPVTQTCVDQLARLTVIALQKDQSQSGYVARKIRDSMVALAEVILQIPELPLTRTTSQHLQAYFSTSTSDALPSWIRDLTNAVLAAKEDDESAYRIISNLEQWADDLYVAYKKLLIKAVQQRSQFTFDAIHGIQQFTTILAAASTAPACKDFTRKELRKHAEWLFSALTWIPDDKESITFVETFQLVEVTFEEVLELERLGCDDLAEIAHDVLLSWTFKAGKHEVGWGTLESGLLALILLATRSPEGRGIDWLVLEVQKRLQGKAIDKEIRERAATRLNDKANRHRDFRYATNRVDQALSKVDRGVLHEFVQRISDLLVPPTVVESDTTIVQAAQSAVSDKTSPAPSTSAPNKGPQR